MAEDTQKSHAQIDFNITYFQLVKRSWRSSPILYLISN